MKLFNTNEKSENPKFDFLTIENELEHADGTDLLKIAKYAFYIIFRTAHPRDLKIAKSNFKSRFSHDGEGIRRC